VSNCTSCGRGIGEWEQSYYDSYQLCSDCYRTKFSSGGSALLCTKCMRRISESEVNRSLGYTLCNDCAKRELAWRAEWVCALCKKKIREGEKKIKGPDGKTLCEECARKGSVSPRMGATNGGECSKCKRKVSGEALPLDERKILCRECTIDYLKGKKGGKGGISERLRHLIGR
jgi:hypothetical protein